MTDDTALATPPAPAAAAVTVGHLQTARQWEIQPYDFDDFLVWSFERGFAGRLSAATVRHITTLLNRPGAKEEFAAGMLSGVVEGARARLHDEIRDTLALVTEAVNWLMEAYTVVYDPVVLGNLLTGTLLAEPADRSTALSKLAAALHDRHPATSGAIDALAETIPALDALAEWLGRPEALRQVLGVLARESADMLGDAWSELVANAGRPRIQGELAGRLVGTFAMELALILVGL